MSSAVESQNVDCYVVRLQVVRTKHVQSQDDSTVKKVRIEARKEIIKILSNSDREFVLWIKD
jgi:hypothetical protein